LATLLLFGFIPQGFIPQEDMGSLIGFFQLNPGASIAAYEPVSNQARTILNQEKAKQGSGISDFGICQSWPISGFYSIITPRSTPSGRPVNRKDIRKNFNKSCSNTNKISTVQNQEPMIPGFGGDNSISIALTDKSSGRYSIDEFYGLTQQFSAQAAKEPSIHSARTQFSASKPAYQINIDRTLLGSLDLDYDEVVSTIAAFAGGVNINQTSVEGGPKDVVVISQPDERSTIDQLMNYAIKNSTGDFVTLKQVASYQLVTTPDSINHFNFNRSINYGIAKNPLYSSGQAMRAAEDAFTDLNLKDVGFQFTGLSRVQSKSGGQILILF